MNKNIVGLIGVFDLIHEGHLNLIERASRLGNLKIGVVCDKAVRKQKGDNRPFFNEKHRLKIIESLKGVSKAYIIKDFDIELLYNMEDNMYFPSLDIIVRGEDQAHVKGFEEILKKDKRVMMVTLNRTPDISSTELIKKFEGSNATNIK